MSYNPKCPTQEDLAMPSELPTTKYEPGSAQCAPRRIVVEPYIFFPPPSLSLYKYHTVAYSIHMFSNSSFLPLYSKTRGRRKYTHLHNTHTQGNQKKLLRFSVFHVFSSISSFFFYFPKSTLPKPGISVYAPSFFFFSLIHRLLLSICTSDGFFGFFLVRSLCVQFFEVEILV